MAYQFVNQQIGKASVGNAGTTTTVSIAGINTKNDDADQFRRAIELFVGIVGWTIGDLSRVVTQDVEQTT